MKFNREKYTGTGWGPAGWKAPECPGGLQAGHEPLQQRWPMASWAALRRAYEQVEGGDPSPLLSTCETHLEWWVQFWASLYKTVMDWNKSSEGLQRG